MEHAAVSHRPDRDPAELARRHMMLRFAFGTTAAFVLAEVMGWYPTFLPPLFAAVLLANLPVALPPKLGLVLILVEGIGAFGAYALTSLLVATPIVVFGLVGLVLFASFATLARGKGFLPILLILVSFATIPIVTLVAPQQAGGLPLAFTRGMAIAVVVIWVAHAVWPATAAPKPPVPMASFVSPIAMAVAGCAIVLPLMLVFLLFGITDALPVMITTVMVVINFDPRRGATQAAVFMVGNFIGGVGAVVALSVVQMAPSLAMLFLVALLIGAVFAIRIERGGAGGAVALVTYNQTMVMFSLALVPGGADTGLWVTRLLQFGLACAFALALMTLLLPRLPRS
jgi:hypothetical protein